MEMSSRPPNAPPVAGWMMRTFSTGRPSASAVRRRSSCTHWPLAWISRVSPSYRAHPASRSRKAWSTVCVWKVSSTTASHSWASAWSASPLRMRLPPMMFP